MDFLRFLIFSSHLLHATTDKGIKQPQSTKGTYCSFFFQKLNNNYSCLDFFVWVGPHQGSGGQSNTGHWERKTILGNPNQHPPSLEPLNETITVGKGLKYVDGPATGKSG